MKRLSRLIGGRTRKRSRIAGFTLLEMLVVILIIGVLFAIAAPSWDALLSRQRVSTAREQVIQAIRKAQGDARSSRVARAVVFDPNPTGVPQFSAITFDPTNPTAVPSDWQKLGGGEIRPGALQLSVKQGTGAANSTTTSRIAFDSNGSVDVKNTSLPFIVTLKGRASAPGSNRCVRVETILGANRVADGSTDCP